MEMALDIILILIFNETFWVNIVLDIIERAGLWTLFKKCGTKPWYALIPCYSEYVRGKCAARESEGRAMHVISFIERLLTIAEVVFVTRAAVYNDSIAVMLAAIALPFFLISLVYRVRIAFGLCSLFNKKKYWIIPYMILSQVVLLYWGLNKKNQPRWKVEDMDEAVTQFFSSGSAAVMEEGLTLNLKDRTAKEWFSKKTLLRDVHMYIKPGSMVLLLGGSGAGKTTLLNAINGYEKANAEVYLNGGNVYQEYKRMQYDIGFVPQQDLMRGNDTVYHTLMDAATLRLPSEFNGAKRRERVDAVMNIFGLTPVSGSMVSKLSGGQRKRLSIALEFLNNPSLFILDEPDSGLDGVMARELMQQLRMIADQGKIIIVITHTPDRVIDLFDDVIVLAKDKNRTGRLAYYGSISEARTFFDKDSMEHIVRCINREEEGGEGRADEFIEKFATREVTQNA